MPTSSESFVVLAPGKLVIAGEYAVLDGGPALVLAIDRGVRCDVTLGNELQIETPDGDSRFVVPALHGAPRGTYRFSTWNPALTPGKPGFGGSAAACVAACIAAGRPKIEALDLHHQVQGSGSGADVAASIAGGMIRFQRGRWSAEPVLQPIVVWSGQSAQTGPRVEKYLAWDQRKTFVDESTALVSALSEEPISVLREISALLRSMAKAVDLDYLSPAHERIRELAERLGGAAKPSGAGGGDCAIALLPDKECESRFRAQLQREGLTTIVTRASHGAHRTRQTIAG